MNKLTIRILLLFLFGFEMLAFASPKPNVARSVAPEAPAQKAWIAKAARVLGGGKAPTRAEVDELMGKSKQEVLELLLQRKQFAETMLDFSMYFIGKKRDSYFDVTGNDLEFSVSSSPQALAAMYELQRNGDYFQFFEEDYKIFALKPTAPRREVENYTSLVGFDTSSLGTLSDEELQSQLVGFLQSEIQSLKQKMEELGQDQFCKLLLDNKIPINSYMVFANIGLRGAVRDIFSQEANSGVFQACFNLAQGSQDFVAVFEKMELGTLQLHTFVSSYLGKFGSKGTGLADLEAFEPSSLPLDFNSRYTYTTAFNFEFWNDNGNSSTNFNRRRAATILKRYFCDDLVPINVAEPEQPGGTHGKNAHASDPACQACHYKLDPMAGFFRSRGIAGIEFLNPRSEDEAKQIAEGRKGLNIDPSVQRFLLFDDNAIVADEKLDEYLNTWKFAPGESDPRDPANEWKVGLVRSNLQPELNIYGKELKDLFRIVREAPESKRCLTKRMVNYLLGEGQRYDPAWIDLLSAEFSKNQSSTKAVQKIVSEVVQSKAFEAKDADPNTCYDRVGPQTQLPCEIASIVEKSCGSSCHSSSSRAGGLAMDTWVNPVAGDNLSKGHFDHLDLQTGEKLDASVSFARIQERLQSTDSSLRMPLSVHMDSRERTELYLWVQSQLQ